MAAIKKIPDGLVVDSASKVDANRFAVLDFVVVVVVDAKIAVVGIVVAVVFIVLIVVRVVFGVD